ncbi:hypothetical protein [Desulfopila aestuarii]|uniref:Uncharacterized protein n=1 Tax=Desulfopila aestuarii DSM 18488 TaxID=1121416 RepID=A0A1M7YG23_9BACT|nr:hypothetical protein [Desulfopila aestuarii]SHO51570.1 hypothetical protein SAMN02745220_04070 [Desulfopila aestuarii DSM 18488]
MTTSSSVILTAALFTILSSSSIIQAENLYSEEVVGGSPKGNHQLDCTVIRPWANKAPTGVTYPIIGWANGWGGGEIKSSDETEGYKPGLIDWAVNGPFVVIAANQWSARERDLLQCVAWNDVTQNGPVLIVGGDFDTTTPPESYEQAWQQIKFNGKGGINASISDGTHNRDAWAPADDYDNPQDYDFGRYQNLTLLWWKMQLNREDLAEAIRDELLEEYNGASWSADASMDWEWLFQKEPPSTF